MMALTAAYFDVLGNITTYDQLFLKEIDLEMQIGKLEDSLDNLKKDLTDYESARKFARDQYFKSHSDFRILEICLTPCYRFHV